MQTDSSGRKQVAAWALIVFAVAVLLRLPCCSESFWLDELHTAWAIWGELGDVAPRAEVGNQTPLYFQLMWLWKQLVGESEIALRLSSVLASSAAAGLLVIAVSDSSKRVSAGILSGLILAVESNSLFFGTELRPYAGLILLSVAATWSAVALVQGTSSVRPANLRLILVTASCLAAVLHPTALVTFGILLFAVFVAPPAKGMPSPENTFRFHLSDLASIAVVTATGMALADSSLWESWARRDQWEAFGKATRIDQLWVIWPWATLVLLPLGLGAPFIWKRSGQEKLAAALPLVVATIATTVFFVASYCDWVPLWHRRYFVAVLPMFAWSAGVWSTMGLPNAVLRRSRSIPLVVVLGVVMMLMGHQGTMRRLLTGNRRLVIRGEDWRGAIQWVNSHRRDDYILLDSGLIEARVLSQEFNVDTAPSQMQWRYFKFPIRGPYFLDDAAVAFPSFDWRQNKYDVLLRSPDVDHRDSLWIISRSDMATLQRWSRTFSLSEFHTPEYHRFGRVCVVRLIAPTLSERKQPRFRTGTSK